MSSILIDVKVGRHQKLCISRRVIVEGIKLFGTRHSGEYEGYNKSRH